MSSSVGRFSLVFALVLSVGIQNGLAQDTAQSDVENPLLSRPALLDGPGSPKEALRRHGINLDLWWTQFNQRLVEGDGDTDWQSGGKGDVIVTVDLNKLGFWKGLSVNVHQEFVYGEDVNSQGDGTFIPVNTALGFPRLGGYERDTSIIVTQKIDKRATLTVGKFNMLDAASRTPLVGGGGLDTFQNTALAAPISGVTPPYLVGGLLTVRTKPAVFSLFVYDPRNAQDWDVIESPFEEGVTTSLSATIPVTIAGRSGFQNVRGVYSTEEGIDLRDVPQLALPLAFRRPTRSKAEPWYLSYSFQQFLVQSKTDPSKGWGIFGEIAVSDGNPNPLQGHYYIGVGGTSFLPRRTLDRWGVAYFSYELSNALTSALAAAPFNINLGREGGVEAYYNLAVTPWFRVTGNLQFINPFPAANDESIFAGVRTQVKF